MKYILKKILSLVITLLIISFVTFFAFSVIPGDAAVTKFGLDATPEQVEELRAELGLNENILIRYGKWFVKAVTGDFGVSSRYSMPVSSLVSDGMAATFGLAIVSLIMIVLFSIPLALLSSRKPNGALDNVITVFTHVGMATPQFFLGMILTLVFGIWLSLYKIGGYVSPSENFGGFVGFIILPAVAVSIPKISQMVKFLRDCIVSEKKSDYVRTAKAKGNTENRILFRHILKNAIISTITFFAMVMAEVLAGSMVVEQVFGIPGLGKLLVASVSNRDFPVVSAIVLYMAALVVVMNTLADISYRLIDPRVSRT